ncbi:MAG: hypothetical protein LBB85_06520 [Dysgonamonadaceae bacterium]|jgi:hypothetical protein|nr:hypothetical protein [Dysgonamonadaceae bacterium]
MRTAFLHPLRIIVVCIWISVPTVAQERDAFKDLMKESLKEAVKSFIQNEEKIEPFRKNLSPDSTWKTIEIDVNKHPLPRLGYNHKLNSMYLNYKDSLPLGPKYTISPYATAQYTNRKQEYDPTSTEMNVISDAFLRPVSSMNMINPMGIFIYLMHIGVLPNEPLPAGESKHKKAVRLITKEIYPNDE